MDANQADLMKRFADVTGADDERSKFFLESSGWQLEVAMSNFFEHGGVAEAPNPGNQHDPFMSESSGDDTPLAQPTREKKKDKKTAKKKMSGQRFATLNSLQQSSSSDSEEGEAFYAGGSETSGQQILGPPGKSRRDIVADMFKTVRERGMAISEQASEPSGSRMFGGAGYRLGATADDHEQVSPSVDPAAADRPRSVRLLLFREGFTVDDGPLRPFKEPQNAIFLDYVRRGEVPPELVQAEGGGEVRVSLEDRRHEECPQAHGPRQAGGFQGKGHMLGSPTPPTVGQCIAPQQDVDAGDREANQRNAQQAVQLDDKLPVTTIQIRLSDGSRLTGRFNHTHTVASLRNYITTAVPAYQLQTFVLLTTFPSTELSDHDVTLEQAKLINTVVVQRLK